MGQYYFARWRLASSVVCRLSLSVTLPAAWRVGGWCVGGRAADTARRASTVTSR